jgi:hypothetical protein
MGPGLGYPGFFAGCSAVWGAGCTAGGGWA